MGFEVFGFMKVDILYILGGAIRAWGAIKLFLNF
jgi:hypothetical protein